MNGLLVVRNVIIVTNREMFLIIDVDFILCNSFDLICTSNKSWRSWKIVWAS